MNQPVFYQPFICVFSFISLCGIQGLYAQAGNSNTALIHPEKELSLNGTDLSRIGYNHPGLIVDLEVGLCSLPMPVDYNGDGLVDLIITAGQDVPDGYTYFFENSGTEADGIDVFKPGVRIGPKHEFFTPSYVRGQLRVLGFNREYSLWDLDKSWEIYPEKDIHLSDGRIRANQWSYVDYDGDGELDLMVGIGDWEDYGWDDAFDREGKWTKGPLHGYIYLIRNGGTTAEPAYETPRQIHVSDGHAIDVYGRPSPNYADFDGDGRLDLITGNFLDELTFFKNVGTRTEPRFASGVTLGYKGEPIQLKGCMIRPTAYDWDGDHHLDFVVGSEDGSVALIRHTGKVDSNGIPIFEPPRYFKQFANELKAGVLTTPTGVDWNNDGKQDLIVGNAAGNLCFIENLGGTPPKWAAPRKLEADGKEIRILAGYNGSIQGPAEAKWGYTVPSVADWNNDGLPDILVNSILGKISWFENIGTRSEPKLAAAKPISVTWSDKPPKPVWNWWEPDSDELATQWRTTPQAIDLNGDGLTDLVALDSEGFLAFFERRKIKGKLNLMPPKRIFYVERDSCSVFDGTHRAISEAEMGTGLSGYDENGELAYFGRKWDGHKWGGYSITHRIEGQSPASDVASRSSEILPLRLNGGWAGRSGRRKFVLVDWNGDGKLDLLVNGRNANLLENVSRVNGEFVFRDRGPLAELKLSGHECSPTVVNWNNGSRPDLLIGAEDGYFYYLKNRK